MSGAQITEKTVQELVDLASSVVEMARAAGAEVAEVVVRDGTELTAKVRLGEPELVQEAGSRAVGLRIIQGGRRAVTYTSDLRRDALAALCRETLTLAELSEPDPCSAPPDPSELARTFPELDLYDPAVAEVDAAWALAQAIEGERAARGFDKRVTNSEGATWSRTLGASAMATSGGFAGGYRGSYASLVVEPLCDDDAGGGDPKKRNGHYWTASRFLAALEDAGAVGREAARRTVATLGSRKIDTQECAIVFDPDVARSLVGTLVGCASGGSFWRKSTYLLGREGTAVASPLVHIVDDPHIARGPGSRPFDGDGLATRRNLIVEDGVLRTVLCDVYAGRKLGRPSTGSASRGVGGSPSPSTSNVVMRAGTRSRADIVRETGRGLYVTSLMGFGFNAITGDFSRGAQGFWIEGGELTYPVSEITISANFDDILKRIDAVGDDPDTRTSTVAPTVRVSHMMVAGGA